MEELYWDMQGWKQGCTSHSVGVSALPPPGLSVQQLAHAQSRGCHCAGKSLHLWSGVWCTPPGGELLARHHCVGVNFMPSPLLSKALPREDFPGREPACKCKLCTCTLVLCLGAPEGGAGHPLWSAKGGRLRSTTLRSIGARDTPVSTVWLHPW